MSKKKKKKTKNMEIFGLKTLILSLFFWNVTPKSEQKKLKIKKLKKKKNKKQKTKRGKRKEKFKVR
jgi:hypothetical protein